MPTITKEQPVSNKDLPPPAPRPDSVSVERIYAYKDGLKRMPYVLNQLGFETMREGQDRAVKTIMSGRDSVVILPTSLGKSACFIIPTLCMKWKTIIVYPLIALMRDQVQSMQQKGLSAGTISSNETDAHNASVLGQWASGELQFMLVSPERFANEEWSSVVQQVRPDLVAMDEAHTFGEWADTFRPGYKSCGHLIQKVEPKVVAAFSATLSVDAEKECREGLGITAAELVYHYPRRKNLNLSTVYTDNANAKYAWVLDNCIGPTIIYASTRARVEGYSEDLQSYTDRKILYYHGGMTSKDRKYQQDSFMNDPNAVIVATNAFGMGIDKSDIRNVVHYDIPGTLVALAQEIGRAGRDGKDSFCTVIPSKEGVTTQNHFIRCGNPTQEDIRAFYEAAKSMREGNGVITAKRNDIAFKAGLDPFLIQAIMAFCHGERMFINDQAASRKMRIKFEKSIPTMTATDKDTRDGILDVATEEEDDWFSLNLDALAEQLGIAPTTCAGRLTRMSKANKIQVVKASTKKPLRLGYSPDEVPAESFIRLDNKARKARADLQLVLDYTDVADEDKHDFLEQHLNR